MNLTEKDKYFIDKIIDVMDIRAHRLIDTTEGWLGYSYSDENEEKGEDEFMDDFVEELQIRLEKVFGFVYCCKHIHFHYGVSKLVVRVDSLPVVIKIPLISEHITGCLEDNYIEDEIELCNILKQEHKENLLKLFAENIHYKKRKGVDYYLQPKVSSMAAYTGILHSDKASDFISNEIVCSPFNEDWLGCVYDVYGEDFLREFNEYFNNYNEDSYVVKMLSDMHGLNYGYNDKQEPVIFDYAGWEE